jgi:hypothetical protein
MMLEAGVLALVEVELEPRRNRQLSYRVRYQLEGSPARLVQALPSSQRYLIATIRDSEIGDSVRIRLTDDGSKLIEWRNLTEETLLGCVGPTCADGD